ncbi:hypothetical protein GCM10009856_51910 [Mycolicibacterium llatzerense]
MTAPGLDPASPYSRHLAARFLDFTSPKTPWARRLFQSDIAAVARMNSLLADPAKTLKQVSGYVEASRRRMYRCRNVIVHGGSTRGDVLDSTLRVVAPLVGATLDRLTHAHLVLGIEPLQLATRADVAISMASDQKLGSDVVDLLGGS